MHFKKYKKTPLLAVTLLLLMTPLSAFSTETNSLNQNIDTTQIAGDTFDVKADEIIIESPLVSNDVEHAQLLINGFDPEHFIYPVKIISINDWQVDELLMDTEFLLAAGDYDLIVEPDFSNIVPKKSFMVAPWDGKHVSFNVQAAQQLVISSRLTNRDELQWSVEIYVVDMQEDDILPEQ